jgi:hypothetical protein
VQDQTATSVVPGTSCDMRALASNSSDLNFPLLLVHLLTPAEFVYVGRYFVLFEVRYQFIFTWRELPQYFPFIRWSFCP